MPPIVPATPRESSPCGVFAIESARIAWEIPGASRSSTERVASGVTSRAASPVPPVVRTRSASSASSAIAAAICSRLVGHEPALDLVAVRPQELLEGVAASVLRLAPRDTVGDGQHRCPQTSTLVFSISVTSVITIPLSIAFAMS